MTTSTTDGSTQREPELLGQTVVVIGRSDVRESITCAEAFRAKLRAHMPTTDKLCQEVFSGR